MNGGGSKNKGKYHFFQKFEFVPIIYFQQDDQNGSGKKESPGARVQIKVPTSTKQQSPSTRFQDDSSDSSSEDDNSGSDVDSVDSDDEGEFKCSKDTWHFARITKVCLIFSIQKKKKCTIFLSSNIKTRQQSNSSTKIIGNISMKEKKGIFYV